MRRECQEILPGLLLGPFQASKSLDVLLSHKITHIVCIRDAKEAFSVRPRFQDRFHYLTLDVEDSEEQNLIRVFPSAKAFIDSAIRDGGRVLVHCNGACPPVFFSLKFSGPVKSDTIGGISLSPAFVVMFAMQYYQLSWEDALHMVQNRRYCISPNGGFLTQIKEYESIYKARLAMASYPASTVERATGRRKREADDEDEKSRDDERKRPLIQNDSDDDTNAMVLS